MILARDDSQVVTLTRNVSQVKTIVGDNAKWYLLSEMTTGDDVRYTEQL